MWLTLISNWKIIASAIISLLIACSVSFIMLTIQAGNHRRDLEFQKTQLITQCQKAQAITREMNDAIVKNLQGSNNQCAAALRMPSKCVPVTAGGTKLASARFGHVDTGIEENWLTGYEAECKAIQTDYHLCVAYSHQCSKQ